MTWESDVTDAELLLRGGTVHVMDAPRRVVEAIAIGGGRIVAAGSDAHVRTAAGPRTEVIDLDGRSVLPGFQDAHVHPMAGGLRHRSCDLTGTADPQRYAEVVRAFVREHPDADWVTGGGWRVAAFPGGTPTTDLLDDAAEGRPAILVNTDGHGAWASRRALERAGIDRDTPDPPDGRIERDPDGTPSGTLHEGAMQLVQRLVPPPDAVARREALRWAQRHLHGLGITAWQDAIVGGRPEGFVDPLPTYRELDAAGELTARVVGALWWERSRGLDQLDQLVEWRGDGGGDRFRATSVKIMQDGVCENFTAAMLHPYVDGDGHGDRGSGLSFVDPGVLREAVPELDRAGFQVHVHAIGDRAVREALDAFAEARRRNGVGDRRHHIAHVQVVHPDDVPRFARLGVVVNAQPLWAMHEPQMDELTLPFLGEPRGSWQYPWGRLRDAGAQLAFGSDWPVSSADPFEQLHVAVHRRPWPGAPDLPDGADLPPAFLPEQRLDLPTALAAATIGSAFVNHLDTETGTLEVGKAADLVVTDRDLFAARDDLAGTRALLTLVDGRPVHDDLRS